MGSYAEPTAQAQTLAGRVAIVTGGSSGFGYAISSLFAASGAKVFIGDMNPTGAQKLAAQYPNSVIAAKMNVTQRTDWDSALKTILDTWGKLDILINNAGTSYKNKPTVEVTEDEYRRCFDVNCFGIFNSIAAIFPYWTERKQGGICVNISSCGASRPRQGLVWYNASKGAVSNATKGLALEFGPHQIRCNSICPLLTGTGL
jgi:NAD(P)-dependent dehydrogenase (short-subunit alcohol dehydrogenase family)